MDYHPLDIKKYTFWRLQLNPYQCYLGRCVIALNRDGNIDPFADTTPEERLELEIIIRELTQALTTLFQPDLFNYDNLRNVWHHCHWHVVPRYATPRIFSDVTFTDTRWGKNWPPYDDTIPSEALLEQIRVAISNEIAKNSVKIL